MNIRETQIHETANVYGSQLGAGTKVAAFVEVGDAVIGDDCKIQVHASICPGVEIGHRVFIGPGVRFTNDRQPRAVGDWDLERTTVADDASIGAGAIIGPGVTIGRGAFVSMGSIVAEDVPANTRYDGRPESFTLKPWFATQNDVGLSMTFDEWRNNYDQLTFADHAEFYDDVFEIWPSQQHYNRDALARFFQFLPWHHGPLDVLEIGGADGDAAAQFLSNEQIRAWYNFEASARAIADGYQHPRYIPRVTDDFCWRLTSLPPAEIFIATHVLEHIRAAEVDELLGRLDDNTRLAYVESPLPERGPVEWSGGWNTHILEIGWHELEQLFREHRFRVTHRDGDVRHFAR